MQFVCDAIDHYLSYFILAASLMEACRIGGEQLHIYANGRIHKSRQCDAP